MRWLWVLTMVAVSLASGLVAFVVLARDQVGEPRPVGTVCDFEHDPGSGKSAEGRVEHLGWLVPRESCVHATDGENEQQIGFAPYLGALVTPALVGAALSLLTGLVVVLRPLPTDR